MLRYKKKKEETNRLRLSQTGTFVLGAMSFCKNILEKWLVSWDKPKGHLWWHKFRTFFVTALTIVG